MTEDRSMKILLNVNKLEKMIRRGNRDCRRLERPIKKTIKKLTLQQKSYQDKKRMIGMFVEQRDKLMTELHLIQPEVQ